MDQGSQNSTPPRHTKPGPKKDPAVATAILAAAAELIAEQGYGRLTIRDIARQAGTGLGTVYNYYDGKDAMGILLIEKGVQAVHTAMQSILTASIPASSSLSSPGIALRSPASPRIQAASFPQIAFPQTFALLTDSPVVRSKASAFSRPEWGLWSLLVARILLRLEQTSGQRHSINELTPELSQSIDLRAPAWRATEIAFVARAIHAGQDRAVFVSGPAEILAQPLFWAMDGLMIEALLPSTDSPATGQSAGTIPQDPPSKDLLAHDPLTHQLAPLLNAAAPSESNPLSRFEAVTLKVTQVADLLVSGIRRPPSAT